MGWNHITARYAIIMDSWSKAEAYVLIWTLQCEYDYVNAVENKHNIPGIALSQLFPLAHRYHGRAHKVLANLSRMSLIIHLIDNRIQATSVSNTRVTSAAAVLSLASANYQNMACWLLISLQVCDYVTMYIKCVTM